jgi:hypothetical protein
LHVVDPKLRDDHKKRLTEAGIDLGGAEQRANSSCATGRMPICVTGGLTRTGCLL